MIWWQRLLDSPTQLAIMIGVVVAIVAPGLVMVGWHLRGWWISKRPDGPLITRIKQLEEERDAANDWATLAVEHETLTVGYATHAAQRLMSMAEEHNEQRAKRRTVV